MNIVQNDHNSVIMTPSWITVVRHDFVKTKKLHRIINLHGVQKTFKEALPASRLAKSGAENARHENDRSQT